MEQDHSSQLPLEVQAFAERNFKIYPAYLRKRAACFEGFRDKATCDVATLRSWHQQYGPCNWGALTSSQFFVLDIDDALCGERWLDERIERYGAAGLDTLQASTQDGTHRWFRNLSELYITSLTGKYALAPKVEILASNHQAFIPPSIHPEGATYTWRTPVTHPILPAPGWLLSEIEEVLRKRARKAFSKHIRQYSGRTIPVGERNSTLASIAGSLRRPGLGENAIKAALLVENAESCDPPLDESEVSTIAASIAKYEPEPQLLQRSLARVPLVETSLFETAAEFSASAPIATDWIIPPFVPAAGLVELTAKIKLGKSTLVLGMARAVLDGATFLEQPCSQTPVIYCTEMPESSLREALTRAGIANRSDLTLLRWHKTMGIAWADLARMAVDKAQETKARLLVFDTLSQFAALSGSSENDSGTALEVLKPLQAGPEHGISVLIVRHEKKGSDNDVHDAGRGSSAFAGGCDILLRLRKLGSAYPANYRLLETLSRFDQTPPKVTISLEADGYHLRDSAGVAHEAAERNLLDALPGNAETAVTCLELSQQIKMPRTTVQNALNKLVSAGDVQRIGAGVRGLAFKFYRPADYEEIQ